MALSYDFIVQRADQAGREAADSVLENVRERALRSEKAWRMMAAQVLEVARVRERALQKRLIESAALGK